MKELILLAGRPNCPRILNRQTPRRRRARKKPGGWLPTGASGTRPRAASRCPPGLYAELRLIRAEHMAWAYDLARLRVGGREVQERLKAGENLSMWWCSLLYERHPKMTPNLYAVYKLRALERLMDAEGFTALRLCGGDALLRRTLAEFCAASGRLFAEFHEPGSRIKPAQSPLKRLYEACPAPLRAAALLCSLVVDHPAQTAPDPQRNAPALGTKAPATIVTYFPNIDMRAAGLGRFRSRYWESLHDALNAEALREDGPQGHFVRWLLIRFPRASAYFRAMSAAARSFPERAQGRCILSLPGRISAP